MNPDPTGNCLKRLMPALPRCLPVLLFLVFCFRSSAAQPDTAWKPEKSILFHAVSFTTDNLGNIYFITRRSRLVKFDISRDTTFAYNDFRYGSLGTVDATNPLQPVLFYPDFGTILIMDRFLALQNTIDLRKLDIFKADAAADSYDNNLWIYDEQSATLEKIDLDGNLLLKSPDLRQVLGLVPQPDLILDQHNLVYLNDPGRGIFVFDHYGSYRNELHFKGVRSLQLFNGQLVMFQDDRMTIYDLKTLTQRELTLPDPADILMARMERNALYVLRKDRLEIYPVK